MNRKSSFANAVFNYIKKVKTQHKYIIYCKEPVIGFINGSSVLKATTLNGI